MERGLDALLRRPLLVLKGVRHVHHVIDRQADGHGEADERYRVQGHRPEVHEQKDTAVDACDGEGNDRDGKGVKEEDEGAKHSRCCKGEGLEDEPHHDLRRRGGASGLSFLLPILSTPPVDLTRSRSEKSIKYDHTTASMEPRLASAVALCSFMSSTRPLTSSGTASVHEKRVAVIGDAPASPAQTTSLEYLAGIISRKHSPPSWRSTHCGSVSLRKAATSARKPSPLWRSGGAAEAVAPLSAATARYAASQLLVLYGAMTKSSDSSAARRLSTAVCALASSHLTSRRTR